MSGLVKAKKYDWKDSNLALFGSDTEKQVKKDSAATEPAWEKAGQSIGLQIWRIVKFKVTHWPKDDYGSFYDGDSYIILNTYKKPDSEELLYDLHFWIGKYSSQDEYGTAAYKTVELDTLLDDKPVQHREVQNHESSLFMEYFEVFQIMKGGAESGFRHVTKEKYKPRLLHFHGERKNITIKEVPCAQSSLIDSDVFVLDAGDVIHLWYGKTANKDEKFKAAQYVRQLASGQGRAAKTETYEQSDRDDNRKFQKLLPETCDDDDDEEEDKDFKPCLYRLSDASGEMNLSLESEGSIPEAKLDPKDVFIADTGKRCFVWVGRGASRAEKQNAMSHAHQYLQGTKHPIVSITVINDDDEPGRGKAAFRDILS